MGPGFSSVHTAWFKITYEDGSFAYFLHEGLRTGQYFLLPLQFFLYLDSRKKMSLQRTSVKVLWILFQVQVLFALNINRAYTRKIKADTAVPTKRTLALSIKSNGWGTCVLNKLYNFLSHMKYLPECSRGWSCERCQLTLNICPAKGHAATRLNRASILLLIDGGGMSYEIGPIPQQTSLIEHNNQDSKKAESYSIRCLITFLV